MKRCWKCDKDYPESDFRIKKHPKAKDGQYISNVCRHCENKNQRDNDAKRRAAGDAVYIQKRRDAVKKYHHTNKGKENKRRCGEKYKEKNKEYYQAHRKEYYQAHRKEYYKHRLGRLRKEIDNISDEYIITQLQSKRRKIQYTRAFLKENPHLIEEARIRILNHRLKKKIEELSEFGFCVKCGKRVKKAEFRVQQKTKSKTQHIIRLCINCRKENSKKCWDKYKANKNSNK